MTNIKYYFNLWRKITLFNKYDKWCDIHNDELREIEFAQNNNMDTIYWCWNCKYHECDIHS